MTTGLFFVTSTGSEYLYKDLLERINSTELVNRYCYIDNTYEVFIRIILAIVHNVDITLLDADFSHSELVSMGINVGSLNEVVKVSPKFFSNFIELRDSLLEPVDWHMQMFTSGTTGIPKRIEHSVSTIARSVRISEKHKESIWGFAYNPTHMAGIQVFFQALLNGNSIIDLFRQGRLDVLAKIDKYRISNISATPTFYRLLLPIEQPHSSVVRLTSGGERFDMNLIAELQSGFPQAQFRNIYASTEAGAILESKDEIFTINNNELCRVEDETLWIHKSLVGGFDISGEWYNTGDLVTIIDQNPTRFKFVSRINDMINVGGNKVNPIEVETVLNSLSGIVTSRVYGLPNRILGNILVADIIANRTIEEKEIRYYLSLFLQSFKIPRIINYVKEIKTSRSGKIKRI